MKYYMIGFFGLMNDSGRNIFAHLYLDNNLSKPYQTNFYLNDICYEANVDDTVISINKDDYEYDFYYFDDEIICAARKKRKIIECLFPCLYRNKFFVLSNKITA